MHNFETLVEELKENTKNIRIYTINRQRICDIDNTVPKVLCTFKGTMKIHELSWTSQKPLTLQARQLTCLKCETEETCNHYGLGTICISPDLWVELPIRRVPGWRIGGCHGALAHGGEACG